MIDGERDSLDGRTVGRARVADHASLAALDVSRFCLTIHRSILTRRVAVHSYDSPIDADTLTTTVLAAASPTQDACEREQPDHACASAGRRAVAMRRIPIAIAGVTRVGYASQTDRIVRELHVLLAGVFSGVDPLVATRDEVVLAE